MKKHPLLLSTLLLMGSVPLSAQEKEQNASLLKESVPPYIPSLHITGEGMFSPFAGSIMGTKVRVRTQPNLESAIVKETESGEMFVVVGETNGYYAVIPHKGSKGYVFRTFVLNDTVEGDRVNIRLYADIDAPAIGQLNTGDKISCAVSDTNSKWLEIELPESCRFYIAKEYVENRGTPELVYALERKKSEATHLLSAAYLFAQSEIQKPFEEIDFDQIQATFSQITKEYSDISGITDTAKEATALMQDLYLQKKIAFLEKKASGATCALDAEQIQRIAPWSMEIKESLPHIASASSLVLGLSATLSDTEITDKMLLWKPLEESYYHLWAAANGGRTVEEFYTEKQEEASILTGIVEPYNRPVKNKPGDFLLRSEHLPIAFLYSTHINLDKWVGKKVTLIASPRPNHHFAFPAYYVMGIE